MVPGFHVFLILAYISINNQRSIYRLQMGNRSLDNGFIQYCLLALYHVLGIMPQGLEIKWGGRGQEREEALAFVGWSSHKKFWGFTRKWFWAFGFLWGQITVCKTVCLIRSLVAWAPYCLLPQCWFQDRAGRGLGSGPYTFRGGSQR